jgi:hypothetical protein
LPVAFSTGLEVCEVHVQYYMQDRFIQRFSNNSLNKTKLYRKKCIVTYKEIQAYVKDKYGCSVKTCWIAHAKELAGLPVKSAPNRISKDFRTNPCPDDKKEIILDAFRYLIT